MIFNLIIKNFQGCKVEFNILDKLSLSNIFNKSDQTHMIAESEMIDESDDSNIIAESDDSNMIDESDEVNNITKSDEINTIAESTINNILDEPSFFTLLEQENMDIHDSLKNYNFNIPYLADNLLKQENIKVLNYLKNYGYEFNNINFICEDTINDLLCKDKIEILYFLEKCGYNFKDINKYREQLSVSISDKARNFLSKHSNKKLILKYKNKECSICQADLIPEDINENIITKCNHYFHMICIGESLKYKKNCPLCRAIIEYYCFTSGRIIIK